MKILVPTKRVPDTDQRITLREDRRGINDDQLPFVINPFDAIALEEAIRLREAGCDAEILIVGIGTPDYEEQLRSGLAMGADGQCWSNVTHRLILGTSLVSSR